MTKELQKKVDFAIKLLQSIPQDGDIELSYIGRMTSRNGDQKWRFCASSLTYFCVQSVERYAAHFL